MNFVTLILNILLSFFNWKSGSVQSVKFKYYKDELAKELKKRDSIKEIYENYKSSNSIPDRLYLDRLFKQLQESERRVKDLQSKCDKAS